MKRADEAKWTAAVAAETRSIHEALSAWADIDDKTGVMRQALGTVTERGTALRLLLLLGDQMTKAVFPELVDLCSTGHSDIGLCRTIIKSLPRMWLLERLESEVDEVLARFQSEESFRRFAELYREIDQQLLQSLVCRARKSPDSAIREVADDFASSAD